MNPAGDKTAKLQFAAIYIVSLVLIFVVVSAFWQKGSAEVPANPAGEREAYFMQYDTLLHAKLGNLDERYTVFVKGLRTGGDGNASGFLEAKGDFERTLASLEKEADMLSDGVKKETIQRVTGEFRKSLQGRYDLVPLVTDSSAPLYNAGPVASPDSLRMEMEALKRILVDKEQKITELENKAIMGNPENSKALVTLQNEKLKEIAEKNKTITDLQTQLKQKDLLIKQAAVTNPNRAVTGNTSTDSEWKQKYSALKTAYDKAVTTEKSLRNAYKVVADDNRRLLGQLQSLRKN